MRTRFIVAMTVSVMTMAAISGCGAKANAMDNAENNNMETIITENAEIGVSVFEETGDEMGSAIVGGWSASDDSMITDEVKAVFDMATKDLTGVDYQPVAYLGSQVVAGINHAILCRATAVMPEAKPYYTIMYIYEDLEGNATIQEFSDIELGWN